MAALFRYLHNPVQAGNAILRKDVRIMEITKNTVIGDILDADPSTAPYFLEMGMHCLGCPSARGESLGDACAVHGVDADALVEKLNAHMAK